MVGQIAKSLGLRVVGIAGGADKCKLAVDHFGFDVCLDHRAYGDAKALRSALKEACPKGIDIQWIARSNRDFLRAKVRGL